jgi:hypothetical protein
MAKAARRSVDYTFGRTPGPAIEPGVQVHQQVAARPVPVRRRRHQPGTVPVHQRFVRDALARQFRGIRFRMIDEQGRIRRRLRIFLDGEQMRDPAQPLRTGGEPMIVQAPGGG